MSEVLLALLIFGPAVITYFLKSNAALAFLAVCAGFVLNTSVIGDLKHLLSETSLSVTNDTIGLILLLVPLLLTLLLVRKVSGQGPLFFMHLLAALCAGGLLALSAGPLLTASSSFDITSSNLWNDLTKIQSGVIGAGAGLSFFLIWFSHLKHSKKH